ncbi:MAG: DinB family protein [Chitinophagales bacterium]|nr:DinB family protein [Bacteroidota bacterium]
MNEQLIKDYKDIEVLKQKYLERTASLSDEILNKIPSNGGWSVGQVLYHCGFAEDGIIKIIHKNLAENKVKLKSDFLSILRSKLLVVFLKSPLKFKAPKVVSSVPEHVSYDEMKKYYKKNSVEFQKILNELPSDLEDKFIFKHPILGLFNIQQTLDFLGEHYQHHERQLDALLGK